MIDVKHMDFKSCFTHFLMYKLLEDLGWVLNDSAPIKLIQWSEKEISNDHLDPDSCEHKISCLHSTTIYMSR